MANDDKEPSLAKHAKSLKDVIEAIERLKSLEIELHQQVSKTEELAQKRKLTDELSQAVCARTRLLDERCEILKKIYEFPESKTPQVALPPSTQSPQTPLSPPPTK
jgi:hypothetical protein